ncbi:MAG: glycosyltransferase family 4 protein [Candidatus Obscuribacter sp.]|nr:glycosyltransferase family 4 protein [Candidatus Obscuribacter sp.]
MAGSEQLNLAMVVRMFDPAGGGLELYAFKLVQALLKKGHKVTVLCQESKTDLQEPGLTVLTVPQPKKKLSKAERLNYNYEELSKLLAAARFDLVHSQHCPVKGADIVTFHQHTVKRFSISGDPLERLINEVKLQLASPYKIRLRQDEELLKSTKLRIFVSQICRRDYYETYGIEDEVRFPYLIVPPGAELQSAVKAEAEPTTFTFLFIGKGYRKKGLDTLYKACALLKKDRLKFKLLVVGMKDSPGNRLTARLHNLDEEVELLGFQRDLENIKDRCQVIVVPSKCEAFGMSPIEAMLKGLPAIVSSMAGVTEVLEDGVDSLILHEHLDHHELARHMRKLMEDKLFLSSLKQKAMVKAATVTWDKTVELTESAYKQVLKQGAAF